jgi:hypothetical protein
MRHSIAALLVLASLSCTGGSPAHVPCAAADVTHCLITQQACDASGAAATCQHCGNGEHPSAQGACEPIDGTPITHDFPDQTIAANSELLAHCRSWTLNNETDLWVTAVELTQHEASHHSNWTYVPDDLYPGPDGIWTCADRGYDQLTAALSGGVLYAQSTQAVHEVQAFPNGAAVRIPAHSRIVSDIHLLNVTSQDVTGHVELSIYTLPRAEVRTPLTPFHITIQDLQIPPHEQSRFETTCELATGFERAAGMPIGMHLYYSLPHTHALGTRVFLQAVGGPLDGQTLLDVRGTPGEARGLAYDTPIDLAGLSGMHFGCEFENPTTDVVHWGFNDQEMCEMLGFIESPVAFEGSVSATTNTGTDGTMPVYSGSCSTIFVQLASGMM